MGEVACGRSAPRSARTGTLRSRPMSSSAARAMRGATAATRGSSKCPPSRSIQSGRRARSRVQERHERRPDVRDAGVARRGRAAVRSRLSSAPGAAAAIAAGSAERSSAAVVDHLESGPASDPLTAARHRVQRRRASSLTGMTIVDVDGRAGPGAGARSRRRPGARRGGAGRAWRVSASRARSAAGPVGAEADDPAAGDERPARRRTRRTDGSRIEPHRARPPSTGSTAPVAPLLRRRRPARRAARRPPRARAGGRAAAGAANACAGPSP